MKRKIAIIISLLCIVGLSATLGAYAATKMTLIVNGKVANTEPVIINGSTYVPVRAAAELLGAAVTYDPKTKTVTVTSAGGPKPTTGKGIGALQTFDGLAITLNSVEYKTTGSIEPKNDQFVVLDLTIQNTTKNAINVSTLLQMKLQDSSGYKHTPTLYIDGKGTLDGEVSAGDSIRGQIAFDVDKSSEYKFIFAGVLQGQVTWTFKQ